jgi:hypothetical protein
MATEDLSNLSDAELQARIDETEKRRAEKRASGEAAIKRKEREERLKLAELEDQHGTVCNVITTSAGRTREGHLLIFGRGGEVNASVLRAATSGSPENDDTMRWTTRALMATPATNTSVLFRDTDNGNALTEIDWLRNFTVVPTRGPAGVDGTDGAPGPTGNEVDDSAGSTSVPGGAGATTVLTHTLPTATDGAYLVCGLAIVVRQHSNHAVRGRAEYDVGLWGNGAAWALEHSGTVDARRSSPPPAYPHRSL